MRSTKTGSNRPSWARTPLAAFLLIAASLGLAQAQTSELTPRVPLAQMPVKAVSLPPGGTIVAVGESPYRLVVKFNDDVKARAEDGELRSLSGADLSDVRNLALELRATFSPLIKVPSAKIASLETRAAQRSGKAQPDLLGMLTVHLSDADGSRLEAAGEAFQALPQVEYAHIETLGPPPPFDIPPPTLSYEPLQGYFRPNGVTGGMDVDYAWSLGFRGAGVRLTDVEYNWLYTHEDLNEVNIDTEVGQTPILVGGYQDHGTAVVGSIGAQPNAYGIRGMAAAATIATYSEWTLETPGHARRVDAIASAIADSDAGDVVLLEMQYAYFGGGRFGPAELDPNVWNVVDLGTDAGVVVVAAAGNGNENLDHPAYAFYLNRGDSGAIIVGAGTPDAGHHRINTYWGSTYGSRVNVQGWGESVVTLCCGDLAQPGDDRNQAYTAGFNGTSSASPFVASAAAILQQAARERLGGPLTSEELRELLVNTGIPQGNNQPGHIGPFPNLRAAIEALDGSPTVAWNTSETVPIGEQAGLMTRHVQLNVPGGGNLQAPVRVRFTTYDGTAHAGEDYYAGAGEVVFPVNSPDGDSRPVEVFLINDTRDEPDETFSVRLSDVQGGDLGSPDTLNVLIRDDDPTPTLSASDCGPVTEGDGGTVPCTFNVTLSAASGRLITVQYTTLDGTAQAGADYVPVSGQLTFPPGTTLRTVTVGVIGDLLDEAVESFSLKLSAATNAEYADDTGVGTILDNDPPPVMSIGDCSVTEGTGNNVDCTFNVALSTPSGQGVSVQYATQNGTAKSPNDYVAAAGLLSFPAGTTSRTVAVAVVGDLSDEPVENFSLKLSAPVNAILTNDTGTGTITDNDDPPTMSIRDVKVSDRNFGTFAFFTVSLSAPSGFPVSVNYATADVSATAGQDYVARSGVLTFPLDTGKQAVAVPIIQDVRDEGAESFRVGLSGAVFATILDGQADGSMVERSTLEPCSSRLDPVDDQTGLPVDLLISEIDPGDHIELYNPQATPLALAGVLHHLTSPLESVKVAGLGGAVVVPAHGYARLPWPPEFRDTDEGGEVILYRDRHFENSQGIVDFVCWGTNPHESRIDQANEVGKWLGQDCGPGLAGGALHRLAFTKGITPADYDRTSPPSPESCAAAFKVTRKDDMGDGTCDGDCSLRDAVAAANASPGHDTIVIPALDGFSLGGYRVDPPVGLLLTGPTDMVGDGARSTIVEGGGPGVRLLEVAPGAALSIRGLTLRNGDSSGDGGAITSAGELSVTDSTLSQNRAQNGGAIAITNGKAGLLNVTLSGNEATGNGGALFTTCVSCGINLTNVTVSGNRADGDGGGVYHGMGTSIVLRNSTITANHANADGDPVGLGGGVAGVGTATFRNTVLAGNTAAAIAGGFFTPSDCTNDCGCIVSEGYNLVGTNQACPFPSTTGDRVGSPGPLDPMMGPLANNSGPADTHALQTGSLAIDTGGPGTMAGNVCAATDERSFLRPQEGNGAPPNRCDKGAFELCPNPFSDVPSGSPMAPFITEIYCRGIASGCAGDPPRYCPTAPVTREQIAVFLVGALGEQPSGAVPNAYFGDVADNAFAGSVNRLYELGITSGCGGGNFCPTQALTREQMAVFLILAMEEQKSNVPFNQYFNDIDDDFFAPYINRLFELGITAGCGGGGFCPDAPVTRQEMAVFLVVSFFRY
jgi:hypothetical protein